MEVFMELNSNLYDVEKY